MHRLRFFWRRGERKIDKEMRLGGGMESFRRNSVKKGAKGI